MFVLQVKLGCNARADAHTRALLMIRVFWDVVSLELLFPEDERVTIPRNFNLKKHTDRDTASHLRIITTLLAV
jgi:hypothetical protein